ncbi:MAG: divalent-cation tolerance protein CutA [Promethearchaeota archaeon]
MMNYYLFLITAPSMEQAKKIARTLVNEKIAACVNIIPQIVSIYRWKGKIEEDNEALLIAKTNESNSEKLIKRLFELHEYEVPECIGFQIMKGNQNYLQWIDEVVE